MAEQMPISSSSPAELVDGAWKDNVKEAPAEQAQVKKDLAPEKLNCDSAILDSGSGSKNDTARGDGSSIVDKKKKKKKKVVKEKAKKKSSGKKKENKLQCDSSDSDSVSSVSSASSASDSVSSVSSASDSASSVSSASDSVSSDSSSDSSKPSVEAVNMEEKEKKGVMDKQIKKKYRKKGKEGVEVPEKAIDKLELKKKEKKKKEQEKAAQEKFSGGTGEDTPAPPPAPPAAPEKPMEVEDAHEEKGILEKIKGQLIGHGEPTEGQQHA